MGWLSKAFKKVVRVSTGLVTGGLSESMYYRPKEAAKDAKAAAAAQQKQAQMAAVEAEKQAQGSGQRRRQQMRNLSLLGGYQNDSTGDTLLG